MGIVELIVLAIGLSMDAFAVSICKGLAAPKIQAKHMALAGLWFGGFQALMPLIGFFLGSTFEKYITSVDHWIAFALLALIGASMIKEAFAKDDSDANASFGVKSMLLMAVATSIDALAVGITFGLLPDINIVAAVSSIGVITFIFSAVGVKIGNIFGSRYRSRAQLTGGVILIALGSKILLEHLGVFG